MTTLSYTLYHGTTEDNAERLLAEGWTPNSGQSGGNCGQRRYLYLTNAPENALWFAEQKGGNVVLQVTVPAGALLVNPEDGVGDTVEDELAMRHGLPGSVVLARPIGPEAFARHGFSPTLAPR